MICSCQLMAARAGLPPELIFHVYQGREQYEDDCPKPFDRCPTRSLGFQIYQGRPDGQFQYIVRLVALNNFITAGELECVGPAPCSLRNPSAVQQLKQDINRYFTYLIPQLLQPDSFCKLEIRSYYDANGAMAGPVCNLHNGTRFRLKEKDSPKTAHELLWLLLMAIKKGEARVEPQWIRFNLVGLDVPYYLLSCEVVKARLARGHKKFTFYMTADLLAATDTEERDDNEGIFGSIEMAPALDGKTFIPTVIQIPSLETTLKLFNYKSASGIKPLPSPDSSAVKQRTLPPLMFYPGRQITQQGKGF